jgi:hypothetical protein
MMPPKDRTVGCVTEKGAVHYIKAKLATPDCTQGLEGKFHAVQEKFSLPQVTG